MSYPTVPNPSELPYPVLKALRQICADLTGLLRAAGLRSDGTFSVLQANGVTVTGDAEVGEAAPGDVTFPPGSIAFSALASLGAETLLGRGAADGSGSPVAINLGSGLLMTNTTLSVVSGPSTLAQALIVASLRA